MYTTVRKKKYIFMKRKRKYKENYKKEEKNSERVSVDTLRLEGLRNTKSLGKLVDQLIAQASIYNLGK